MTVRLAQITQHDTARLTHLLGQLGYPTDENTVQNRLHHWLDDPASTLIAARDDHHLIGVAAVHAIPLIELTGKMGRLVALVVDHDHRGQGIGQLLVTAAEQWARTTGCIKMEITSSRHRTRAHTFYEQLGYDDKCATAARFLKPLTPEAPHP